MADQTTTPSVSSTSSPLQNLKAQSPAYQKLSDQEFADKLYDKYYRGKIKRADYDLKIGLVKPVSAEEQPAVNVGGKAFTFAAHAGQPFVDVAAGVVQHGAEVLKGLGLKVDPKAAEELATKIRLGYKDFTKRSQEAIYKTTDEEHPYASAGGDVTGQLALYSTAGAPFMEGAIGRGLLKFGGPMLGRIFQGMSQGAAIESLKSNKKVGSLGFFADALEGSVSAGLGAAVGAGAGLLTTKTGNAIVRYGLLNRLEAASKGWTVDNQALAKAFQTKLTNVQQNTQRLTSLAQRALLKDNIVMKDVMSGDIPSGASKETVEAIKLVRKYVDDTEFLKSNVFNKLKNASESGTTFTETNSDVLKKIMGDNKELSARFWKAFSPEERTQLQKGIIWEGLQKSAKDGEFDPEKLKKSLDTAGVKEFFPKGGAYDKVVDGYVNLARIVSHAKDPSHGLAKANVISLIAHTGLGAAGAGLGLEANRRYGSDEIESKLAYGLLGFMGYVALAGATGKLAGTPMGRAFLSATANVKPNTPEAAKVLARLLTMTGTAVGGTYGSEAPAIMGSGAIPP